MNQVSSLRPALHKIHKEISIFAFLDSASQGIIIACYWFAQSTPRATLTATLRARRRWAGVSVMVKVHPSF